MKNKSIIIKKNNNFNVYLFFLCLDALFHCMCRKIGHKGLGVHSDIHLFLVLRLHISLA